MSWEDQQGSDDFAAENSALSDLEDPSTSEEVSPEEEPLPQDFEELTLAQAMGLLRRAPLATLRALAAVAQAPVEPVEQQAEPPSVFAPPAYVPPQVVYPTSVSDSAEPLPMIDAEREIDQELPRRRQLVLIQLLLRLAALGLAIWGGMVMLGAPARNEANGLDMGAPYLLIGFLLWLLSDLLRAIFDRTPRPKPEVRVIERRALLDTSNVRMAALGAGVIMSLLAWALNGGNMFTLPGVIAWFASIVLWVWALAPEGWMPLTGLASAWRRLIHTRVRLSWTLAALVVIMLVGGYFRLTNLRSTPPEMTSDHVEELLDVNRVLHGETNVFFANNHGREAIQFYALALMAKFPGAKLDFTLAELLTVIEGLITLPVLWWMGRQVIGEDEPRLGNLVGLLIAALVAVSYWHEMLSRLGLRIVLTPLFTALLIGFLARALRYNRRSDFIWIGVTLGVGVYAYQADRMLPVVVVLGVGIALIFGFKSMRDRRALLMNLIAVVLVSFVIFVPLFRYSLEYPQDFWRRTSGRLFGDALTEAPDANGNMVMRTPTTQEEIAAFDKNVPVLLDNFRNALLMYNWKGDVAWINNAPLEPAFDVITGALLILGIAAWLTRMARRRDAFDWTLLPLILIMMLPSALSIAYPIENPSATRMSGTLPGVYLLCALPLALILLALPRLINKIGTALAIVGAAALVLGSFGANYHTFFDDYRTAYIANSQPYSAGAAVMREFASTNGYGNAFILAYPYWWDHRALAIDAGQIDWSNTILKLEDVPNFLQQSAVRPGDLRLDVTKDILFFYDPQDTQSQVWLQANFPQGTWQNVPTYQPGKSFNIYRVPALGADGFARFLQKYNLQPLSAG